MLKYRHKNICSLKLAISWLIFFILSSCSHINHSENKESLKIHILNIGQGDAILLEKGTWRAVIDGGPSPTALLDTLKSRKIDSLDFVALTHHNLDHSGGLNAVLSELKVGHFYSSSDTANAYQWNKIDSILKQKQISSTLLKRNDILTINADYKIRVLWPLAQSTAIDNAASLALKIDGPIESAFLGGDLGQAQEDSLITLDPQIKATYLKVSHHGSKFSSSLYFLGSLSPKFAAISVGKDNSYNHPEITTLANLKLVIVDSTHIQRTDLAGTITWTLK
jgi:beta-lactamase superfamily II metal-dependent hydrolase